MSKEPEKQNQSGEFSYEQQKSGFETSEAYKLPAWSRKTFLCMWPLLFVLLMILLTQSAENRGEVIAWFLGVMAFCMVLFRVFDRYFE